MEKFYLHSDSCVCYKNTLFFATNCGNVLLSLDLKTEEIVSDFSINLLERIESLLLYKDYILAFSLNGKNVHIIDLKDQRHKTVFVGCNSREWGNYNCKAIIEDKLVIVPATVNRIIEVDLKTFFVKEEKLNIINKGNNRTIVIGSELFFFSDKNNKVCIYNVESRLYIYKKLPLRENSFILQIQVCETDLLMLDNNGYLYKTGTEIEEMETIGRIPKKIAEDTNHFVMGKKKIFLLPKYGRDIFILDIEKDIFQKYDEYPDDFKMNCPEIWTKYARCFKDDRYYYFSNRCSDFFLLIDRYDDCTRWIAPKGFSYETWIRGVALDSNLFTYEGEMRLGEYLDYVKYK